MQIPMVDLRGQNEALQNEIESGFREVIDSTRFILGPHGAALEEEIAAYCGVRYAIGVASGTDALHLALLASGIGPGDEVITTPFTFIATGEAIRYVGAKAVFVDIDPDTLQHRSRLDRGGHHRADPRRAAGSSVRSARRPRSH